MVGACSHRVGLHQWLQQTLQRPLHHPGISSIPSRDVACRPLRCILPLASMNRWVGSATATSQQQFHRKCVRMGWGESNVVAKVLASITCSYSYRTLGIRRQPKLVQVPDKS